MVKISDVIAKFLVDSKIDTVFGIIGSANAHIYDSIQKINGIKLIPVHHEQAAVMAMGAYYRSTGKMSAALVTAGGGSSNALTGVISNWADSIPGIIFSGQEQSYYLNEYEDMRMYGVQGYNSNEVYSNVTKLSEIITEDNIYDVLEKSYYETLSNRPGPVFLEIPFDTQSKLINDETFELVNSNDTIKEFDDENDIISLINKSERPVIIAGHGIKLSNSEILFNDVVDRLNIPITLTWSAIDLLPEEHINNYGRVGVQGDRYSNFIIQNSDLVIVLGSRLSLLQTGYDRDSFAPQATIVHIDIDSRETNKFKRDTYIPINENVSDVLTFINNRLTDIDYSNKNGWYQYCNYIKNKYPRLLPEYNLNEKTNSYIFIDTLSKKLNDDYVIVTDMGTALLSGFYGFNIKKNQKMFTSLGLGEMGYGLAAAVGAGFSGRPVMCLNCDGGMMMNLQELQTIKSNNLPVKIVIFNNDGYLMIKHTQKLLFNDVRVCVDKNTGLELPVYEKIADAFGFEYFTEDNLDEFLNYDGQAFLEVFMDSDQEFIPKVRAKVIDSKIIPGRLEDMYPFLPESEVKLNMGR